jgi:hypothetical protein
MATLTPSLNSPARLIGRKLAPGRPSPAQRERGRG